MSDYLAVKLQDKCTKTDTIPAQKTFGRNASALTLFLLQVFVFRAECQYFPSEIYVATV
jgi:hypothetical protein